MSIWATHAFVSHCRAFPAVTVRVQLFGANLQNSYGRGGMGARAEGGGV